jgi:hypothetical protein
MAVSKTSSSSILFVPVETLPKHVLCVGVKTPDQTVMLVHKECNDQPTEPK